MSRKHKEWTDEERKKEARFSHAFNRLNKIDGLIEETSNRLKILKAERKRLKEVVE